MSRSQLLLLITLFALLVSPGDGVAQVNPPRRFNSATGELFEQHYALRYQHQWRDQQRKTQLRRSERLLEFRERDAKYAADACGLGCYLHEGLQVRGIPGTFLSVALYKALVDDDALTLQLRFHNDGAEPERLTIDPSETSESYYVQVGEGRLYILEDENGELESKGALNELLEPGEIESWWARFPAPPHGTTTFDLHLPAATFRDVPLETD